MMWRIYFKLTEALWWLIVVCFCAPMLQMPFWKLLIIPLCYELLNAGMMGIVKMILLKVMGRRDYLDFQFKIHKSAFESNVEEIIKEAE